MFGFSVLHNSDVITEVEGNFPTISAVDKKGKMWALP